MDSASGSIGLILGQQEFLVLQFYLSGFSHSQIILPGLWYLDFSGVSLPFVSVLDSKDKHAVAVYKDDVIVGHVPYNISASLSAFFAKRPQQSICRGDWGQGEQRSRLWPRDTIVCIASMDQ